MIVIAAPMKREAQAVTRSGASARSLASVTGICVTGVGGTRAPATLGAFLDGRPHVDGVLAVGFAGALQDGLNTGDLVAARRLLTAGGGDPIECDRGLLRAAEAALERSGARWRTGDTLTVEAALGTAGEKRSHGRQTGALVVTMEDYWLARECARRGVPFLSVRSVLDVAAQELPPFVADLGDKGFLIQAARVALGLAAQPRHFPAVARLGGQVGRARRSLAPFVVSFLEEAFLEEVDSRPRAAAVGAGSGPRR